MKRQRSPFKAVAIFLCGFLVCAACLFAYDSYSSSETADSANEDQADSNTAAPDSESPNSESSPSFKIVLSDYKVVATGTVSGQETANAIALEINKWYPGLSDNQVQVDSTLPARDWENALPGLVGGLSATVEGELEVTDQQMVLRGQAPQDLLFQAYLDIIAKSESEFKLPPFDNQVTAIEEAAPELNIKAEDGKVNLVGRFENSELVTLVVSEFETLYGKENVTNNIEVDENVFTRIPFTRLGTFGSLLFAFGDYEVDVTNDLVSLRIVDGFEFKNNEIDLSDDLAKDTANLAEFLNLSTIPIRVIGHTDSVGSEKDNEALGLQRAQAVADLLLGTNAFFFPERIVVESKGETEPRADNETEEGRLLNRRVEIIMTPENVASE